MPKKAERLTAELKLRVPEALRKRIAAAAAKNGVSLNTEIIDRLDGSASRGLLEEILALKYGAETAAVLASASVRGGELRITAEGKVDLLKHVSAFLDRVMQERETQ